MRAEQRNSEYVAQLKFHPHPWGVALKTVDTQGQKKVFFVTSCCSFKSGHTKVEKSFFVTCDSLSAYYRKSLTIKKESLLWEDI